MFAIPKFSSKAIAVLALTFPVAFMGCDEVQNATLIRTAQSPLVLERTADVPVYATQCSTYTVYGQHSSCGYHKVCQQTGGNYHPHPAPAPGHHGPGHHGPGPGHHGPGHHGPGPGHHPGNVKCWSQMNSCYHPETRCVDVFSHNVRTTLRLRFDESAILLPGESEKINLEFSGRYATKSLKMDIDSARYVYSYPKFSSVTLYGPQQFVDVDVRVNKVKAVRPPNNLRIVDARYVDGETLRIQFEDPYRFVRDIRQSGFRFQVKRGLNTYVDAEIRSVDLQNQQGAYVVEIRKGSSEWKRDPRRGKEHSLKWSVERDSILFTDRFSKKEKMSIRY